MQLSLFLCLEQKNSLTSTLPWIVIYLLKGIVIFLLKGIRITEHNSAFQGSWDWSQRGNVLERVFYNSSRLLWRKHLPEIVLTEIGETEVLLTEVRCWTGTHSVQMVSLWLFQLRDGELIVVPLLHASVSGWVKPHLSRISSLENILHHLW